MHWEQIDGLGDTLGHGVELDLSRGGRALQIGDTVREGTTLLEAAGSLKAMEGRWEKVEH